jgi:hypothetical protein
MLAVAKVWTTSNFFRKGRRNESIIVAERGSDLLLSIPNREGCKTNPLRNRRKRQG